MECSVVRCSWGGVLVYYEPLQRSCLHALSRRTSVMSLRPHPLEPVPEETVRVAPAAFPKGNPYLLLRDSLGTIFQDDDFAACFPRGWPTRPPALAPGARHHYAVP